MARVRTDILLLGRVAVVQRGVLVERFRTNKVVSLLGYLALHERRTITRETLADALWPDSDTDASRQNLRQTLLYARRLLDHEAPVEESAIEGDRAFIRLRPEFVDCDVWRFKKILAEARKGHDEERVELLRRAVESYGGELLPGIYEDWITARRLDLAAAYTDALLELSELIVGPHPKEALQYARQALQEDPLSERAARAAASALMKLGDRAAAEMQIQTFRDRLQEELGIDFAWDLPPPTPQKSVAPKSERAIRTEIPYPVSRLYGREADLSSLLEELGEPDRRLITLLGAGGLGKTRLAIEAAIRVSQDRKISTIFISMADIVDADAFLPRIVAVLGLPVSEAPMVTRLAAWFSENPTLLVLDNLEQIPNAGIQPLGELLASAPSLQILCTSRRVLGLSGERSIQVSPLSLPDVDDGIGDLAANPAVRMFCDRATAANASFELTNANARTIAELCRLLEGLPLAVELAAVRSGVAAPAELLEGMQNRFELLVTDKLDVPDRHRALYSTIDWSFGQLTASEAHFVMALAIFHGGFTVESAHRVCGIAISKIRLLELLRLAREHSLLASAEAGGRMRFDMFESTRDYALQRLGPEQTERLRAEHTRYFVEMAERLSADGNIEELRQESSNVSFALMDFAENSGDAPVAVALGLQLVGYWSRTGAFHEGLSYAEKLLGRGDQLAAIDRARAEVIRANLQMARGHYREAGVAIAEALPTLRAEGELLEIIRAIILKSSSLLRVGNLDASEAGLHEALDILRQSETPYYDEHMDALSLLFSCSADRRLPEPQKQVIKEMYEVAEQSQSEGLRCEVTRKAALHAINLGDIDTARGLCEELIKRYSVIGRLDRIATMHQIVGRIYEAQADLKTARSHYEAARDLNRAAPDPWTLCQSFTLLGDLSVLEGKYLDARDFHSRALDIRLHSGDMRGVATTLRGLGNAEVHLENWTAALAHFSRAAAIYRNLDDKPGIASIALSYAKAEEKLTFVSLAAATLREAMEIIQGLTPATAMFYGPTGSLDLASVRSELRRLEDEFGLSLNEL